MKQKVTYLVKHPLFSGSAVMILGSNLANAFAYLYHLIIGRMIGPTSYGELAAIISIIGLVGVSVNFFGVVVVKFVSSSNQSQQRKLLHWLDTKSTKVSLWFAISLILLSPAISSYIHVSLKTVILLGPITYFVIKNFVYRSYLQGVLKFLQVAVSANIDMLGRLVLGTIFVLTGLGVFGAVGGLFIASYLVYRYLTKFLKLKSVGKSGGKFNKLSEMAKYSIPTFFGSVGLISLITIDVVLAKHYLDPHLAGIYASVATLGKTIFFASGPVSSVMFPIVSKYQKNIKKRNLIFGISLLLTFGLASFILLIFYIFPELMVKILFGSKFIEAASSLVYYGIFMLIYTVSSLVTNYHLSIQNTKVGYFVFLAAICQIIGIVISHGSIVSVITVSLWVTSFLLVGLLLYLLYGKKKEPQAA